MIALIISIMAIGCSDSSSNSSGAAATAADTTPSISISPSSGPIGTLVTITGTNFDLSNMTSATLNGTAAVIVSRSTSTAAILIMPGSTTGTVTATTASGNQTSTTSFAITTVNPIAAQQGAKLVGSGNTGAANQGWSVALSADGNTALVGGQTDNSNQGAVWVFIRNGSTWSQEGSKLVGTGSTATSRQGVSVALNADGSTALVGANLDNAQGAVWVFTRSGTSWAQQGTKLVGTGQIGNAWQGSSVALSADGNTALVGGHRDNSDQGAVWVFTRSGTTWTQQGAKIVGTGIIGTAQFGSGVALSADGNTALVGGYTDNTNQGAAWVFTRSGTTWTQQGAKIVGTGNIGAARQGWSVALSADGNTALLGAYYDNTDQGAAWVFTRSGTTWTQQGAKLVGTGITGTAARFGNGVSLSADGNTALLGGHNDNTNQGAVWIFTRSGTTWAQQGAKLVGTGNTGAAQQGYRVALSSNGTTALVGGWGDNSYQGAAWIFVP